MSKARVAVLQIITGQLTVTAAAAKYGYSRRQLHRLLARYRSEGLDAVEPRSRRPHSNNAAISGALRDQIVQLRIDLTASGLDAGPVTIAWHLTQAGSKHPRPPPSVGSCTPQDSSLPSLANAPDPPGFASKQPNPTSVGNRTSPTEHLADDTDVEILNWLDDHARFLLSCTAHTPVTGDIVVHTFLHASNTHGLPASTLTDNGRVYTARFGGGRNAFEYLIANLGITQKNGSPNHPQTQGKVERLHQTQKAWLAQQPLAVTVSDLQHQLDQFAEIYNEQRPHRALNGRTPGQAYRDLPKASPAGAPTGQYRLRHDHVDNDGKMSIRRAGRMHHLGIGTAHRGKRVLAITDDNTVTVIELTTSEILSIHHIDPQHSYWRNTQRAPGRWPGAL